MLTTAVDKITCRVQDFTETTKKEVGKTGKLLVFLKTSEEASCEDDNGCPYKFVDDIPTITKVEKEWDSVNNEWTIKVTGTDFSGTKDTT